MMKAGSVWAPCERIDLPSDRLTYLMGGSTQTGWLVTGCLIVTQPAFFYSTDSTQQEMVWPVVLL